MNPAFALALIVFAASEPSNPWRTYAGSFGTRWNTIGHHGHDQAPLCSPVTAADCDAADFERSNLDDSIGFRLSLERDLWRLGPVMVVAGADASVAHTEYNLSQRDFSFISAGVFAGADVDISGVRIGIRHGRGAYATSTAERTGGLRFNELTATVPLRRGAGLRFSRRISAVSGMVHSSPLREASVSLVASTGGIARAKWEFVAATGMTMPGAGLGGDRKLRATAVNRTATLRTLWRPESQLELSWAATAHESSLPSTFRGYDGNFRSKTIEGYGLALSRTLPLTRRVSLRWRGGVELADWRDEHQLLTRDGAELVAGLEVAGVFGSAVRAQLRPRFGIETGVEKVYWRGIDLSEVRWTAGIVLTP